MACEILVGLNIARLFDIIYVAPWGHGWSPNESLAAWVAAGNRKQDWPGKFFVLKIPDDSVTAADVMALRRTYDFHTISTNQGIWNKITKDGEATESWATIQAYLSAKAEPLP